MQMIYVCEECVEEKQVNDNVTANGEEKTVTYQIYRIMIYFKPCIICGLY